MDRVTFETPSLGKFQKACEDIRKGVFNEQAGVQPRRIRSSCWMIFRKT